MTVRHSQIQHGGGPKPLSAPIFDRILVGIDGTEAGFEACRQIARLADENADVEAVAVVHLGPAIAAALDAAHEADVLEQQAETALAQAIDILGGRAHRRYLDGFASEALVGEVESFGASLVALGTHGHHRAAEIFLGGVAGEVLHRAPSSVLIARRCPIATFPRAIVVGHDGSRQADEALAAARQLEARFASATRVLVALAGKHVDLDRVLEQDATAITVGEHPVSALVQASHDADLLVVGSRGLHGLKALGSVSERVAHQAACSVLVVRSL